jgi:hypothetical protein
VPIPRSRSSPWLSADSLLTRLQAQPENGTATWPNLHLLSLESLSVSVEGLVRVLNNEAILHRHGSGRLQVDMLVIFLLFLREVQRWLLARRAPCHGGSSPHFAWLGRARRFRFTHLGLRVSKRHWRTFRDETCSLSHGRATLLQIDALSGRGFCLLLLFEKAGPLLRGKVINVSIVEFFCDLKNACKDEHEPFIHGG